MVLLKRVLVELKANDMNASMCEDVLVVSREDVPSVDVFVSTDRDENIVLCSANIVPVSSLIEESKSECFEVLLLSCPALALSSIGISNGNVIVYGQLLGDSLENIVTEVEFMFDNIVEVASLLKKYV